MDVPINEINLESKRCIYIDKPSTEPSRGQYIYFSNYYLKQMIGTNTVSTPFTIKFTGNEFMNHTLILLPSEIKSSTVTVIASILKRISELKLNNTEINTLDISLYSRLIYTPHRPADARDKEYDEQLEEFKIETNIAESELLKILPTAYAAIENTVIRHSVLFTNIEQVRQYLKYNGFWYRGIPRKYEFDDRANTKSVNAEDAEEAEEEDAGGKEVEEEDAGGKEVEEDGAQKDATPQQGAESGGKKTKTRRRGYTGHNKHRKSKRIR